MGIIGSVFCIIGGLTVVACARGSSALVACGITDGDSAEGIAAVFTNRLIASGLMCMLGAIGTLVGAILDFKKPLVGGSVLIGFFIFQLVGFALNFQLISAIAPTIYIGFGLLIPSIITSFFARKDIEIKTEDPSSAPQNNS